MKKGGAQPVDGQTEEEERSPREEKGTGDEAEGTWPEEGGDLGGTRGGGDERGRREERGEAGGEESRKEGNTIFAFRFREKKVTGRSQQCQR